MANEQGNYSVFRSAVDSNSNLQPIPFPDFNETISFGGNSKTYKELVYSSKIKETLNLPIEVLTNDSKTSRLAIRNERKGTNEVPRPQNSWIIYRRDKYVDPEFEGVKSCHASKKIGKKWKNESNEVLEYFAALSMLALDNHQKKYGGYKYQPKSRVNRKSKKSKSKSKDRQRRIKENVENVFPEKNNEMTDLPQLVVTPSLPINEYPTPVSSITHSPVASQVDFSEQTNNNSYFITPPSSNLHSPVTFQDQNSHLSTNQDSFMTLDDLYLLKLMDSNIDPTTTIMYPILPAIAPTNDFLTYNNDSFVVSDNFSEFFHDAGILAAPQSSQTSLNTTTANVDVNIPDFQLYPENPENEILMPNIILPTVEETANIDQLPQSYNLSEYYDPFSINMATPFEDQMDFYDPFSE